jgi:hypothetical protein
VDFLQDFFAWSNNTLGCEAAADEGYRFCEVRGAARKLLPSLFLIQEEYINRQFRLIQNFLYFQYLHFTLFSPRWQSKVTVPHRCMRTRTHRTKT